MQASMRKKPKIQNNSDKLLKQLLQEKKYDEDVSFCEMLIPMLKNLSTDQKHCAKIDILNALNGATKYSPQNVMPPRVNLLRLIHLLKLNTLHLVIHLSFFNLHLISLQLNTRHPIHLVSFPNLSLNRLLKTNTRYLSVHIFQILHLKFLIRSRGEWF